MNRIEHQRVEKAGDMTESVTENTNPVVEEIHAALIEMLKTTDIDQIRIVDLVAKAGVARSSFYRYYSSVEDVVQEMEDGYLEACRDSVRRFVASGFTEDGLEREGDAIVRVFETIQSNAGFYRAITGPHGDSSFEKRQERLAREFYGSKLFFEGIVPTDADLRLSFIMAGQTRLIAEWLTKYPNVPAKSIAEMLQRVCYAIMHA